jgi:predicted Zn-dependent protease
MNDGDRDLSRALRLLAQHGHRRRALAMADHAVRETSDVEIARLAAELRLDAGTRKDARRALDDLRLCFVRDPRDPATLALLARAFEVFENHEAASAVRAELRRLVGGASWTPGAFAPRSRNPP